MAEFRRADVSVEMIVSRTFGLLKANPAPALLYLVVLSASGSLSDYLSYALNEPGVWAPLAGIVAAIVTIVGGYLLLEAFIRQSGQLTYRGSRRYFAFFGQSVLIVLGVMVGMFLLIIPGLILAARWSVAQTLLVGKGEGVVEAMRKSWEFTRGHTVSILVAGLVLAVPALVVAIGVALFEAEDSLVAIIVAQLAGNAAAILLTAMIVAILKLLPNSESLANVFE